MLLSFLVIIPVLVVTHRIPDPLAVLSLPVVMLSGYTLALGFAMCMSAVTVYLRDMEYVLGILVMAWQFLTPVMYPVEQVPKEVQWLFAVNPMRYMIEAYRDILYYGKPPGKGTLPVIAVIGIVALLAGWMLFLRLQRHFVEEL